MLGVCSHSALSAVEFPKLQSVGGHGMDAALMDTKIIEIHFPLLESIGTYGMFIVCSHCKSLKKAYFPKLKTIRMGGLKLAFAYCEALKEIHFPKALEGNKNCTREELGLEETDIQAEIIFDL